MKNLTQSQSYYICVFIMCKNTSFSNSIESEVFFRIQFTLWGEFTTCPSDFPAFCRAFLDHMNAKPLYMGSLEKHVLYWNFLIRKGIAIYLHSCYYVLGVETLKGKVSAYKRHFSSHKDI